MLTVGIQKVREAGYKGINVEENFNFYKIGIALILHMCYINDKININTTYA